MRRKVNFQGKRFLATFLAVLLLTISAAPISVFAGIVYSKTADFANMADNLGETLAGATQVDAYLDETLAPLSFTGKMTAPNAWANMNGGSYNTTWNDLAATNLIRVSNEKLRLHKSGFTSRNESLSFIVPSGLTGGTISFSFDMIFESDFVGDIRDFFRVMKDSSNSVRTISVDDTTLRTGQMNNAGTWTSPWNYGRIGAENAFTAGTYTIQATVNLDGCSDSSTNNVTVSVMKNNVVFGSASAFAPSLSSFEIWIKQDGAHADYVCARNAGEADARTLEIDFDNFNVTYSAAPEVMGASITDGQIDVPVNSSFFVDFNQQIDGEENIAIYEGTEIADEFKIESVSIVNGGRCTVKPTNNLKPSVRYTLVVPQTVKGLDGTALNSEAKYSFVTRSTHAVSINGKADFETLTNEATAKEIDSYMDNMLSPGAFSARFNGAGMWWDMDGSSYNLNGTNLAADNNITISDHKFHYKKSMFNNARSEKIYFRLPETMTSGKATFGFDMTFNQDFDGSLPKFLSIMNSSTEEARFFSIHDTTLYHSWYNNTWYAYSCTSNFTAGTYRFDLTVDLDAGKYYCVITKDGNKIVDWTQSQYGSGLNGFRLTMEHNGCGLTSPVQGETFAIATNSINENSTKSLDIDFDNFTFNTTVTPELVATNVINGAIDVHPKQSLEVTFNSAFSESALTDIALTDDNGATIETNGKLSEDGYTYKLTPTAALSKSSAYKLTIPAGLTALNGLATQEATVINFTTAAKEANLIVSAYNVSGEMKEGTNISVSATFTNVNPSEDVQPALLAVGVYDENDKLLIAFLDSKNLAANSDGNMNVSFTAPKGISYIKIFAWDSVNNLIPMKNVVIYPNNAS